jgi:hypothetical protein
MILCGVCIFRLNIQVSGDLTLCHLDRSKPRFGETSCPDLKGSISTKKKLLSAYQLTLYHIPEDICISTAVRNATDVYFVGFCFRITE